MAFQPINFLNAPIQKENAIGNFMENLLSGYKAAREPTRISQEEENRRIANETGKINLENLPEEKRLKLALMEMQNQMYKPEHQGNIDLQNARIKALNQKANLPFGGAIAPGAIGQAMWLNKIKDTYGEDSKQYKDALESHTAELESAKSIRERNAALSNSTSFKTLPSAEKSRSIATAVGMGYDPTEAASRLSGGKTLRDLATEKNVKLEDVDPVYPMPGETMKQLGNRKAFLSEIKSLEGNINSASELGGRKFAGYSPTQIISAIKNDNPKMQGKILGARALQPELAGLRLKMAGGAVGIEAIREMKDAALGNSKIFESMVSPEARVEMNKFITKTLEEAVGAYNKSIKGNYALGKRTNETEKNDEDKQTKIVDGKTYYKIGDGWYE